MTTFTVAAANAANWVLAQAPGETPVGPDFGKASPIGLLLLVILGVVVLFIGGVVSIGFLAFGKLSKSEQAFSKGLWGLLLTVISAALLGSLAGLISWGAGLPLIPQS